MAYYCLVKLRWLPSDILKVMENEEEKALVNACMNVYIENEKKKIKEVERI